MKPILVIGGGISGVTAAVELAETGREVIILEREPWLGGHVVRFNNYFPKLCPPACGMEINFRRIRNNRRIRVITSSRVKSLTGEKGAFSLTIEKAPELVNDHCTACGECIEACPVERPDAFNYNFGLTKAIHISNPLAFPQKFAIDPLNCEGTACAKCVAACNYGAIDLKAKSEEEVLEVHAVIVATGWKNYDATRLEDLQYHNHPDIVTNVEFERLLSIAASEGGSMTRPSDGAPVKSISFVQCAGSRDRNHLPYCSAVCCSASLKHALNVAEMNPDADVAIHYIDLRVTGRNEDFLKKVEKEQNIQLVKGKVGRVENGNGNLVVESENVGVGKKVARTVDMVVLATGIVPGMDLPGLAVNVDGFAEGDQVAGIYPAACAKRPMDVASSVRDATSAAIQAMIDK